MLKDLKDLRFAVDGNGRSWFSQNKKSLLAPLQGLVLGVDAPFDDFAWLGNGELVLCARDSLGYLERSEESAAVERKRSRLAPALRFVPAVKLPYKGMRLFAGKNATLYLVGHNARTGNDEVYLYEVRRGGEGAEARVGKLLAAPRRVSAVAGDAETTFIAMDRLIVKLTKGKSEAERVFLHPGEPVKSLAYAENAGLFYATASAVGFLGRKPFEFLTAKKAQLSLRGGTLYIFLQETQEVLKIEGLQGFAL
ncbi:MAG: hypothetical protein HY550_07065 [Elusimicrobia bacterium]|nr:hypothetical protein [Elusimicrobiota bacterium]